MSGVTTDFKETEIGPIPADWEVKPIKDLMRDRIQNGAFIRRSQFGEGVPFLNVADIYKSTVVNLRVLERAQCSPSDLQKFHLQPGDLIFVRSSLKREGVGQCALVESVEEPAIFDCHLMRVKSDISKVEPRFLAYYSSSHRGKESLIAHSKTTTMTTINQSGLANILVPLPPLPEQRRIAHILGTIQRAIAAQDDLIAAARETKRSLMHRLFTYGPAPDLAPTKETEIGEIPEHWEVILLGKITQKGNGSIQTGPFGSLLHASDYVDSGFPVIMPRDLTSRGKIATDEIACIGEQDYVLPKWK